MVFTLIIDGDFLPRESALRTLGEGVRFVNFLLSCVKLEIDDDTVGHDTVDPSKQVKFENNVFSEATSATMDSVSKDDDEFNCVGVEDFIGNISVHTKELEPFVAASNRDAF
jgi:hypothetical protein